MGSVPLDHRPLLPQGCREPVDAPGHPQGVEVQRLPVCQYAAHGCDFVVQRCFASHDFLLPKKLALPMPPAWTRNV